WRKELYFIAETTIYQPMNQIKSNYYIFITVSILFFYSCENDNNLEEFQKQSTSNEDDFYISENEATSMALTIYFPSLGSEEGKGGSSTKQIKTSKIVPDKKNKNAYYIFNYKEGGFLIVSADKRTEPILGFSEKGSFNFDSEYLPNGVVSWLEETAESIGTIRNDSYDIQTNTGISLYAMPCEIQKLVSQNVWPASKCIEDPGDCEDEHNYYGPLMNSSWNQGNGFNNLLMDMGCNSIGGRPPSGCVATALGQVMRYYQSASNYNWSNMPLGNSGSNEISRLLSDVGSAVNMDYDCNGSGANTGVGVNALINIFGYASASFGDWNHNKTTSELRAGRPVILAGNTDKNCFLWWCGYEGGHAWVVEGYNSHYYCDTGVGYSYYF